MFHALVSDGRLPMMHHSSFALYTATFELVHGAACPHVFVGNRCGLHGEDAETKGPPRLKTHKTIESWLIKMDYDAI